MCAALLAIYSDAVVKATSRGDDEGSSQARGGSLLPLAAASPFDETGSSACGWTTGKRPPTFGRGHLSLVFHEDHGGTQENPQSIAQHCDGTSGSTATRCCPKRNRTTVCSTEDFG